MVCRLIRTFLLRRGVGAALLCSAALTAWSGWRHSPTTLEVSQLPAGVSHLALGRFDLCLVNPPFIRTVAALPVWAASPATDWSLSKAEPMLRPERAVGMRFLEANGAASFRLFSMARWACIPFVLLGGWVCAVWAAELYGPAAGLTAACLWCFSPYVLGHGSLMTTDAHAAALGVLAGYCLWRWLCQPTLSSSIYAGIALGLAQAAKFTFLILYPVTAVLWLTYAFSSRRRQSLPVVRGFALLMLMCAVSIPVINAAYAFDRTGTRLGDFQFQSQILSGIPADAPSRGEGGNRFAGTAWESLPVALPHSYVLGLDLQKWDFERGFRSYLRGEWRPRGWWYFHLYALAVKTPLGTLALLLLAVGLSMCAKRYSTNWRHELTLLLPAIAVLGLVSSQTGFSIHSRYVLPALPFLFVWMSKTAQSFESRHRTVAAITGIGVAASVASSLAVYPHSLSYFNELAGGPRRGYEHLVDSDIAWGQDLLYLSRWVKQHPEARPLHLASFGPVDPRLAGIEFRLPPLAPEGNVPRSSSTCEGPGPQPGWFAIDVNHLAGTSMPVIDGEGGHQFLHPERCGFRYFRLFEPLASAGYSIYIYHVTRAEANRARRALGLPELKPGGEAPDTSQRDERHP